VRGEVAVALLRKKKGRVNGMYCQKKTCCILRKKERGKERGVRREKTKFRAGWCEKKRKEDGGGEKVAGNTWGLLSWNRKTKGKK